MSRRSVTIIDFDTIYAPGYNKERLAQEDADRSAGHARHQKLFDEMKATHEYWERVQIRPSSSVWPVSRRLPSGAGSCKRSPISRCSLGSNSSSPASPC